VDRTGKTVFSKPVPAVNAACKLANGTIVCLTTNGTCVRFDATGKELKTFTMGFSVQGLGAIEVLANRRGPNRIPTTMTDANGDFVFTHLGAGEYYVVSHPADAHVPSAEGSPFPLQTEDPVADAARMEQYTRDFPRITVNGESPVEINLRVKNPHFGSISGRIVNANGESVAGASAVILAWPSGEDAYPRSSSRRASPPMAPTRCASPLPRWPRTAATSASTCSASPEIAISATSCGTRRAS